MGAGNGNFREHLRAHVGRRWPASGRREWYVAELDTERRIVSERLEVPPAAPDEGPLAPPGEPEEVAADDAPRLTPCLKDVIHLLVRTGHRLTRPELKLRLDALGPAHEWDERTIQRNLTLAIQARLLDNRQDGDHKGYGFPFWD